MTKRVLLVGSSYSAAPAFFRLKKHGLQVSVCGSNQNDPCHQYADHSFYIDYSDREKLLDLVQTEKFDYLVPTCNDYSYMSCTWVAEKCGFHGFDTYSVARILHNKNDFREFTNHHPFPAPVSIRLEVGDEYNEVDLNFPLLVKPVDSFSGRGVTKIQKSSELGQAISDARDNSRSGSIVLEEFVEGGLHSHSAFIQDGQIMFDVFVDEYCTVYPYQVDCSNHPSKLKDNIRDPLRKSMQDIVNVLGLNDGLLHTQFIADDSNYWIIECMRRCPGDLYNNMIDLSTGIDYLDFYVRPFIRKKIQLDKKIKNEKCICRHTISTARSVINLSFTQDIGAKSVWTVPLKSSGEKLDVAPYDKLAILFAEFENCTKMQEITPHLASHINIQSLDAE